MTRTTSLVIILLIVLLGCSVAPSERTVAGAVTDYFENNRYNVIDLKIGKIEGMPLYEKTYMGAPGYVVDIVSITLDPELPPV